MNFSKIELTTVAIMHTPQPSHSKAINTRTRFRFRCVDRLLAVDQAERVQVEDGVGDDFRRRALVAAAGHHDDGNAATARFLEHDLVAVDDSLENAEGNAACGIQLKSDVTNL